MRFSEISRLIAFKPFCTPLVATLSPQDLQKPRSQLIVIFDAFSAYNIPLYGYDRMTTRSPLRIYPRRQSYITIILRGEIYNSRDCISVNGGITLYIALRAEFGSYRALCIPEYFWCIHYHPIAYTHNGWAILY